MSPRRPLACHRGIISHVPAAYCHMFPRRGVTCLRGVLSHVPALSWQMFHSLSPVDAGDSLDRLGVLADTSVFILQFCADHIDFYFGLESSKLSFREWGGGGSGRRAAETTTTTTTTATTTATTSILTNTTLTTTTNNNPPPRPARPRRSHKPHSLITGDGVNCLHFIFRCDWRYGSPWKEDTSEGGIIGDIKNYLLRIT